DKIKKNNSQKFIIFSRTIIFLWNIISLKKKFYKYTSMKYSFSKIYSIIKILKTLLINLQPGKTSRNLETYLLLEMKKGFLTITFEQNIHRDCLNTLNY
ncbi:hypothetical protein BpHYR1_012869, partial [Brachionus plicatilis]